MVIEPSIPPQVVGSEATTVNVGEELISMVMEVDGPSHFEPVWGEENLERNKRSDRQKTGLIISEGMVLIRIKQDKRSSQRYFRRVLEQVVQELEKITKEFPKEDQRYIEI